MPYHYKDGDDLNLAIMYARGWNDAVRQAALILRGFMQHNLAEAIEELDKSMDACDD